MTGDAWRDFTNFAGGLGDLRASIYYALGEPFFLVSMNRFMNDCCPANLSSLSRLRFLVNAVSYM